MIRSLIGCVLLVGLLVTCAPARSKDKRTVEKDSFDVVGHLALNAEAVTNLVATKHFSSYYVYAENPSAHTVTVIDVTEVAAPRLLTVVNRTGSVLAAAGDAALVSSESLVPTSAKTISILDLSDKASPKIVREFAGVTSLISDDQRALVFLVNAEGLWILHRNQPLDPEIQERYAHDVVYNH